MLFVLLFLPLSLAVYHLSDDRVKEYVLFAISLIFYSLGSPEYFFLFLISAMVTVAIGRTIAGVEGKPLRRALLILGIVFDLSFLLYYKYSGFVSGIWTQITGIETGSREMLLPLGISFYTFKAISYLADIYRGEAVPEAGFTHDLLYLSFFSQIQSGPITRYNSLKRVSEGRADIFSDGAVRFMTGYCKKVLIANVLANITDEVFGTPFVNFSTSYAWLGAVCYSLQLFFDFAGYSDMAIGITEMFGYHCMENFVYPYMTGSVSEFWRRWHISLGEWFRDYVYIPLGGSRCRRRYRVYINLFVVWILTGIWHGPAWNFVLWGLGYFVIISFERITGLPRKIGSRIGKAVYRIFTLLFINFQWVMFNSADVGNGLRYIKRMIVFQRNSLADHRVLFLLGDYAFFIILAIVLCFPVVPWIRKKLMDKKTAFRAFEILEYSLILIAFIWAVSFVVAGQNNPFAYANF